jgi:hypothetical protein
LAGREEVRGHSLIALIGGTTKCVSRSAESDVGAVLLFLGVQMESGVKPLAHNESLSHLNGHLVFLEGGKQDKGDSNVEGKNLTPDREDSLTHEGSEVALSDVRHVGGGVEASKEEGSLPGTLSVVEAVNNGEVLLPLVGVHDACIY